MHKQISTATIYFCEPMKKDRKKNRLNNKRIPHTHPRLLHIFQLLLSYKKKQINLFIHCKKRKKMVKYQKKWKRKKALRNERNNAAFITHGN